MHDRFGAEYDQYTERVSRWMLLRSPDGAGMRLAPDEPLQRTALTGPR